MRLTDHRAELIDGLLKLRPVLDVLAGRLLAEDLDERQRIVKRANDGRTAAKARGARFGRKPKVDAHQQKEALKRLLTGESS